MDQKLKLQRREMEERSNKFSPLSSFHYSITLLTIYAGDNIPCCLAEEAITQNKVTCTYTYRPAL